MALDPEEIKRKRQLRQQQREKRRKIKRLLLILIPVLVLLAVGALLFFLLRPGSNSPATTPAAPSDSSSLADPSQSLPAEEDPNKTVVRLVAAGDLNAKDAVIASGGTTYDYTDTFIDVAPILADGDITLLNFEGNLCGTPYGTESASAPQELMTALSNIGVDMIQLANSYSINHGISGLRNTIDGVRAAGMEPLGVYADENEYRLGKGYTIKEVNGIKIAFIAFTKGMDGMTLPPGSEHCVNVLYSDYDSTYQSVNTSAITSVLDAAASAKPDFTVVLLHWGSEYNDNISSSQKRILNLLKNRGVDCILGTHSHYVQKMEFNEEAGTFVAYSLGDFCSDGVRSGTEYSVILELEITKDLQTEETKVTGYTFTPIYMVTEADEPLRVVQIAPAMAAFNSAYIDPVSQLSYDEMVYALERIAARIQGS